MSFECSQLEEVLRADDAARLAEARRHATSCASCQAELELWDAISSAARELHHEWDSPELWHRIDATLPARRRWSALPSSQGWRMLLSVAAVLVLAVSGLWVLRHPSPHATDTASRRHFLTEQALQQARQSEAAYVQSIDNLAKLAEPMLDQSSSPLMANYREKLTVLDAAIADIRDNLERNRLNARLNAELASLYHEKQQTLQEVLRYGTQSN